LEENQDILFTLKTSLNSFSVRPLKYSACGDRARSTPYTSLEPARPRGKQRQSFGLLQDSHTKLNWWSRSGDNRVWERRGCSTWPNFQPETWPLYTFCKVLYAIFY